MSVHIPKFRPRLPRGPEDTMPYTGTDPDLIDLQNQITNNLNATNSAIYGLQQQINQVTLTLEGELKDLLASFNSLQAYVESKIPN